MNRGNDGKSAVTHTAAIHHNPAYEIHSFPNDDRLSIDSGCPDAVTDGNGDNGYSSISLQAINDCQNQQDDATYSHIASGPTRAMIRDNTYAHIPNTNTTRLNSTYSYLSNQNNRPEQGNVIDTEESTYNRLSEAIAHNPLYFCNDNGQIMVDSEVDHLDSIYSHINANISKIPKPNTDYDDTTYNHLGDIC